MPKEIRKEERVAKRVIEKYFPEFQKSGHFVFVDELNNPKNTAPDLQNDSDKIGIEVTFGEPDEYLNLIKNASKQKGEKIEEFLTDDRFSKYTQIETPEYSGVIANIVSEKDDEGKEQEHICYMCSNPSWEDEVDKYGDAIRRKLKKLNTVDTRKSFEKEGLIIVNSMSIDISNDKFDYLLYSIANQIQKDYEKYNPNFRIFDFIIIIPQSDRDDYLYCFDMKYKDETEEYKKENELIKKILIDWDNL